MSLFETFDRLAAGKPAPSPVTPATSPTGLLAYPDGLHRAVASAVYHERTLGVVSNSALKQMRTPAHYHAWATGAVADEDKPAFAFGRAGHAAILEPEVFARDFIVEPEWGDLRRKENKAARAAWREEHGYDEDLERIPGKELLRESDRSAVLAVRDAVLRHPLACNMVRHGSAELTALWTDSTTGLRCKARADYYVPKLGMLVDVKTTDDASEAAFRKDIFRYSYHWQHALYRAGFAALGAPCKHFVFLAVEKKPPYAVAVYTLDERGIAAAHDRVRSLMGTMAECLRKNEWPAYPTRIQTIATPEWAA